MARGCLLTRREVGPHADGFDVVAGGGGEGRKVGPAARENVRRYRSVTQRCRNFELHRLDAVEYEVPLDPTVFYFYNPFDAVVMAQVLDNIRRSLAESPREVFVVYLNSLHGEQVRRAGFHEMSRGRWHAVYRAAAAGEGV